GRSMIELNGKKAIITGGAGGIGLAATRTFTKAGAEVIIADINEEAGKKAAEETGATFIRCDVSSSQDVQKVIAAANGKLDILYNNAGVYWNGRDGRITEIEEDNWEKIIAINLRSVYLFCKYSLPLLMKQGGSIINTASSAGMIGIPNCDAYTATKGAIVQLTKSMAAEYGRYNVRVNCISPAAIMTPMVKESNPPDSTFDENSFLNLRTPLRRYGTPEEIADLACYLASDQATYLNGAIIAADGGITINGDLSHPDKR
ncbi:MAG: SDR family oxidoreductase, partial [Lentisphaeria bacterium]|nr:SDR family oxidoreductase [Lentisphaeria bacterium]